MPDIVHRVGIKAPAEKVFQSLSTIDGYRGWWTSRATGNPSKGGVITFFDNVDMKVEECKPNELVKWKCVRGPDEWMNTEVVFRLRQDGDETFVLFTHANWKETVQFMHHCSTKWAVFMLSLKDLVELGKGHPEPYDIKIHSKG